jgi:hypothetical protein
MPKKPEPTPEPAPPTQKVPVTFDESTIPPKPPVAPGAPATEAAFQAKVQEIVVEFSAAGKPFGDEIFAEARRRMKV